MLSDLSQVIVLSLLLPCHLCTQHGLVGPLLELLWVLSRSVQCHRSASRVHNHRDAGVGSCWCRWELLQSLEVDGLAHALSSLLSCLLILLDYLGISKTIAFSWGHNDLLVEVERVVDRQRAVPAMT